MFVRLRIHKMYLLVAQLTSTGSPVMELLIGTSLPKVAAVGLRHDKNKIRNFIQLSKRNSLIIESLKIKSLTN